MFDNRDIQILELLQKDGRSTLSDIAKEVDLSVPATGERIKINKKPNINLFKKFKLIFVLKW